MKQTILYHPPYSLERADEECLGRFVMRWAFFGILMWWLSSAIGLHGLAWLIGLVMAFAMVRKEFQT